MAVSGKCQYISYKTCYGCPLNVDVDRCFTDDRADVGRGSRQVGTWRFTLRGWKRCRASLQIDWVLSACTCRSIADAKRHELALGPLVSPGGACKGY